MIGIKEHNPLNTDIVPEGTSRKDLMDEVLKRNAKAGHCTRLGEPPFATKTMTTIPFGKQKLNVWPRDQNGNFIE